MRPYSLRVLLGIAWLLPTLARAGASEFDDWLSVPPGQRAEKAKRDTFEASARRKGEAWLVAYFELQNLTVDRRVAAAESMMKQSPKDRIGWIKLIQAESFVEIGRPEDAIALLDPARTGSTYGCAMSTTALLPRRWQLQGGAARP